MPLRIKTYTVRHPLAARTADVSRLRVAALVVLVTATLTACAGSSGSHISVSPAPVGSTTEGTSGTPPPQAGGTAGAQPTPGSSAPAVGPSPQPWTTPRVFTGSGASLENRTPEDRCKVIFAPYPVRIEGFTVGSSSSVPLTDPGDPAAPPVPATAQVAAVTYQAVPECGINGAAVPGDALARQPCTSDTVITPVAGCAVASVFVAADPQPAKPAKYSVVVTWRLSKLCTDAGTGPCAGLRGSAQPSPDRPVRATWQSITTLTTCVTWHSNGQPDGGEGTLGSCPP
jgi:hypothetical protein